MCPDDRLENLKNQDLSAERDIEAVATLDEAVLDSATPFVKGLRLIQGAHIRNEGHSLVLVSG